MLRLGTWLTVCSFLVSTIVAMPAMADQHKDKNNGEDDRWQKHKKMEKMDHEGPRHMMMKRMMKKHQDRWGRDGDDDRRWTKKRDGRKQKHDWRHRSAGHKLIKMHMHARHALDLSEDQEKSLKETVLQTQLRIIDLKADYKKRKLELKHLKHQDDPNRDKLLSKIDQIYQTRAQLKKAEIEGMFDFRDELDDEQWKTLKEAKKKKHHGKKGHYRRHEE